MLLSPLLIIVVFAIGALIGGVGVGGVLLVPALKYLGGIPLHGAIPACVLSYIATGAVGALIYSRHGTIHWPPAVTLCAGGLPGAYLGAFLLPHFSAVILEFGIAVLLVASGAYAIAQNKSWRESQRENKPPPKGAALMAIGFFTGMGSALTGTGGPLLLIPVLIWCKLPMLTAIGLAQVIQIPISVTATLGNIAHGEVNWALGLSLAIVLTGGAVLGAKLAHILPVRFLQRLVAALLLAAGMSILIRLLL